MWTLASSYVVEAKSLRPSLTGTKGVIKPSSTHKGVRSTGDNSREKPSPPDASESRFLTKPLVPWVPVWGGVVLIHLAWCGSIFQNTQEILLVRQVRTTA